MSSSFNRGIQGSLWAIGVALALQGCGGGGGGGDSGGSSEPDRSSALKLDAVNFGAVSAQGLRAAETPLKLGQHAALEVSRLARSGALQMDSLCYAGTAHYTLVDADGNGVPSAGDSVNIAYARCHLEYFGDVEYDGTLIIRLSSVNDALNGAVAGTLDLGAGIASHDRKTTWLGSLDFRRTASVLHEQLEVSATAADDLRRSVKVTTASGTVSQVDAYQRPQVVRVLERDAARASISGSASLASDALGGRLDVTIDSPLSAYFDTHADSGSVRIGGASNTRISLNASVSGSSAMQAELDSNGDGVVDSTASLDWNSLFTGYVFAERSSPAMGFLASRNDQFLRLLSEPTFNQNQGVDVAAPLRLQFDRPLAANSVLFARLVDLGETLDGLYGVYDNALSDAALIVEADVQFHGAVVLVQPRVKLRYGHDYQVLVSNIGDFEHAQAVTLRTASGTAEINLNVQVAGFNSDDMLWAAVSGAGNRSVVMPGRVTSINATVPRGTSLPLRYQWTQLSGPSLVVGSPTAGSTTVRLADGSAPGISIAELQLTVTDAIGRNSVAAVQLQVANLAGASEQLYFASQAGDYIGAGHTHAYSGQTGSFLTDTTRGFLSVAYFEGGRGANWNLQMSDASGGVPAVGTYTGAVGFGGLTNNVTQMDFYGSGRACRGSSTFNVLEITLDGTGVVQKLAVDFEQICLDSNTPAPLRGSVRINSDLQITP